MTNLINISHYYSFLSLCNYFSGGRAAHKSIWRGWWWLWVQLVDRSKLPGATCWLQYIKLYIRFVLHSFHTQSLLRYSLHVFKRCPWWRWMRCMEICPWWSEIVTGMIRILVRRTQPLRSSCCANPLSRAPPSTWRQCSPNTDTLIFSGQTVYCTPHHDCKQ